MENFCSKLRIHARLPESLWPEVVKATAYIINIITTKGLNWTSPIQLLNSLLKRVTLKVNIAHLYAYGCRAYVYIQPLEQERKSNKLQYRARIGYLVGYDSSNLTSLAETTVFFLGYQMRKMLEESYPTRYPMRALY